MQITAKDLYTLSDLKIILNGQEVEVDLSDDFTAFDNQFNEIQKEVVTFHGRQDSWFCASDQVLNLNEKGKGIINITEGDIWDTYGDGDLPIEVKVVVPLTAKILLKKRIGIL